MRFRTILEKYYRCGNITDKELQFFLLEAYGIIDNLHSIISINPNSNLGLSAGITVNELREVTRKFEQFKEARKRD